MKQKRKQWYTDWKGISKTDFVPDDMISYVENRKTKPPGINKDYNKVADTKLSYKSQLPSYTSEQMRFCINAISFTLVSSKMKYLGINLTNYEQDFY